MPRTTQSAPAWSPRATQNDCTLDLGGPDAQLIEYWYDTRGLRSK